MNAVEIEEAVTALAAQPFEAAEFPFAFLEAFDAPKTTLRRLRSGATNASDVPGGVLQRNNIHLACCQPGAVSETLKALRESPRTAQAKVKFVLATDGADFEAEDLKSGATVACVYADFPDHFGFFLPLAGITTVKEIAENAFDIRATGRLNRLYVELLKHNPDWGTDERRHDMNHFMARLIFCFFAEDTDIFGRARLFTSTVEQMSERDGSNTHEVIETLFGAMNTKHGDRARVPRWADAFPYVNGGLFSDSPEVPRFSRIARAYLTHIGALDWTKINPDIFGSMIQAVAEDEERGALGMHYTSVPNILKVLNPLFLDDLRVQLDAAGDNARMLFNLRKRMTRTRVFDPACGSGNFLVIAYKQMREIEAEINHKRGEANRESEIPLTNFRGIELRDFPAEIARLALIIAEFQVRKAIIVVPERSIGGSFADAPLSQFGFFADWTVKPQWNLCNAPGADNGAVAASKVKAVGQFLASEDQVLVCTHATFRFAFDELGVEAFDDCLIAVDEFHHVSVHPDNRLGAQVSALISRGKAHIVAMTGSYFRGDAVAVMAPEDEGRFETVTYTYYEQLNGYDHLKALEIAYCFYSGRYLDALNEVLEPDLKTIVHIPNVNARESLKDKIKEAEGVMEALGEWKGTDPATGFQLIERPDGRVLRVADLIDDDAGRRDKVISALKDPKANADRDYVDIILALGMAKEGFDWIWCEHALTVGYRASLTEIIQIIGRATRDAPGKEVARFTNLIAAVDASEEAVTEAINDTLKAIAASLLMEQVLAPRFEFTPKDAGPRLGFDYGPGGYKEGESNVGFNEATGRVHLEIKGLVEPKSDEAKRICAQDLNEVIAAFVQDKPTLERGLFDADNTLPEELTQLQMGKIVRDKYPDLSEGDHEAIRQQAVAAMNIAQQARAEVHKLVEEGTASANTALIEGVRKYVTDVRELDIDLIDRINPFQTAYAILAKSMNENALRQVAAAIASKRVTIPEDEARELTKRAVQFKRERGRSPDITSPDAWEKRMAEGVAALARYAAQRKAAGG